MLRNNRTIKIAALVAAIFISAVAKSKNLKSKETPQDIVAKAQNLVLHKNRPQALILLSGAIEKEIKSKGRLKELLQAVHEVSSLFLSEKSQQLFELSLSLKNSDQSLAIQKLNESLQIEPDNYQSIVEKCRMQISINNCSDCLSTAKQVRQQNPYFEPLILVGHQAEVCEKKAEFVFQFAQSPTRLEIYWLASDVEARLSAGLPTEPLINKMLVLDKNYPEISYWKWKMYWMQKRKEEAKQMGMSYINQCRAMSARQLREYAYDPMLCKRVSEVESFLKKSHNF